MEDQKEKVNEKKGEIIKKGPFQLKHTWRDQKGYLFDISLSPDGKKLASTCGYNEFDIYEISTENLLKNVVLESPAINDSLIFVFFHPTDSNRIFCGTVCSIKSSKVFTPIDFNIFSVSDWFGAIWRAWNCS